MSNTSKMAEALKSVDPGEGRFWDVSLVKRATSNPIKVTLMEELVKGRRAMASELFSLRTIAVVDKVRETAEKVLVMVGGYAEVVGQYPEEEV